MEAAFSQGNINHITGDVHFLALLLRKRRTIITIHDCGFMQHPSKIVRHIYLHFWLKWPIYHSGKITAVSKATKEEVLKYVQCPDKIEVIYNLFLNDTNPILKI